MQTDNLLREFEAERANYQALFDLVRREQDALRRANAGEVETIAHEKQAFLLPLAEYGHARAERLRAAGYPNDTEGMLAWIRQRTSAPELCLAAWKRIVALVEEIRACNRINGELIDMQARYFTLALHALHGAGRQDSCYGADGRTQPLRAARPLVAI
jgi:flagellar biosynthesis/type III secretory pathway chaperone